DDSLALAPERRESLGDLWIEASGFEHLAGVVTVHQRDTLCVKLLIRWLLIRISCSEGAADEDANAIADEATDCGFVKRRTPKVHEHQVNRVGEIGLRVDKRAVQVEEHEGDRNRDA